MVVVRRTQGGEQQEEMVDGVEQKRQDRKHDDNLRHTAFRVVQHHRHDSAVFLSAPGRFSPRSQVHLQPRTRLR
jgi:hypothetical protein